MLGLTPFGTSHTAVSFFAVGAGIIALVRDRAILPVNRVGQVYIVTTIVTCLTGFGIFRHGGFGQPHQLAILTLLVLGLAIVARRTRFLGTAAPYVETVGFSLTFFFHLIPAITETVTRLPVGAPLAANAEASGLQAAIGLLLVAFVIGATLQVRRLLAKGQSDTSNAT